MDSTMPPKPMKDREVTAAATRVMGRPSKHLGGDGLLHPAAHAGEQDHGHQEADAGAGGADDALREIIAVVDVQDGHAQDGAVGGDQGQIHTQRLVQRGDELLQHVLQQLHQGWR